MQNRESKLFDIYGTVIFIDNKFRKYSIKTDNGRMLIRNRKFICKRVPRSLLMSDPDHRPKHVCRFFSKGNNYKFFKNFFYSFRLKN